MATQIDLGAVVPIGKGDWNPTTTYERANIVRHNSVAWICKVATSLGVEPTEGSSDWYLLVKDTSSVTSINGMRGDVTIDSVPENPSIDDNSLKIASTAWTNTKISQVDSKAEEALSKTGLPLGHIYLWPFSTPPDGSIQLNGSTYSRELYSDLWNLIQAKGWYKPEAEWQSIASANGGYCPWYSSGDGSTTFRVPKFAPYQKLALASSDAGKYYEAGLPNIVGRTQVMTYISTPIVTGSFNNYTLDQYSIEGNGNASTYGITLDFSASKANSIYGNSYTVQPESNDWIVCVVAFGKATNVGSVDVTNVMSAINQVQGISHLMETWKSDNGMSWYRKWSDGWIEQGGNVVQSASWTPIVFYTPFTSIPVYAQYQLANPVGVYPNYFNLMTIMDSFTTVGMNIFTKDGNNRVSTNPGLWYACGY